MSKRWNKYIRAIVAVTVITCMSAAQIITANAAHSDIKADAWYASAVDTLVKHGVVNDGGNFDPNRNITRAEFVTMLSKVGKADLSKYATDKPKFKDTEGQFILAAEWAAANKIATGYSDGSFRPNAEMTRAEAAAFADRFMKIESKGGADDKSATFNDISQLPQNMISAIESCVKAGILNGYPDGSFRPSGKITRAEAAAMLARFYKKTDIAVSGDRSFADRFNAEIAANEKDNYFISPYSAKVALAMLSNGANGDTKKEILSALKIKDLEEFNAAVKAQYETYTEAAEAITVDSNNSLWLNTSKLVKMSFEPEFIKLTDKFYHAKVGKVDDSNAISVINAWIEKMTRGKIKDCIDTNKFSIALVNTLYFKGAWAEPFSKESIREDIFTQADGSKVKTTFMSQLGNFRYYSGDGVQMIELPYDNNSYKKGEYRDDIDKTFKNMNLSMYIVLTEGNKNADMEALINSKNMGFENVFIMMPKFKFNYGKRLNDCLKQMGIKTAFEGNADFSKMLELPQAISEVLQKTYISVDEKGTEAAAATVVMMKTTSTGMPQPEPERFIADRPFQFVIYDKTAKEVLFSGRYAKVEE